MDFVLKYSGENHMDMPNIKKPSNQQYTTSGSRLVGFLTGFILGGIIGCIPGYLAGKSIEDKRRNIYHSTGKTPSFTNFEFGVGFALSFIVASAAIAGIAMLIAASGPVSIPAMLGLSALGCCIIAAGTAIGSIQGMNRQQREFNKPPAPNAPEDPPKKPPPEKGKEKEEEEDLSPLLGDMQPPKTPPKTKEPDKGKEPANTR